LPQPFADLNAIYSNFRLAQADMALSRKNRTHNNRLASVWVSLHSPCSRRRTDRRRLASAQSLDARISDRWLSRY